VGNVTTCARGCGFRYVRTAGFNQISTRQRQVLARMAMGRSNSEIAGDLGIAEDTVKGHIRSMYAALDVHSREEAYLIVGWLVVPEDAA
jgi:DNA-binding NarL/FixJ family response regulator